MNLRFNALTSFFSSYLLPHQVESFPDANLIRFHLPEESFSLDGVVCILEALNHLLLTIAIPIRVKNKRQIASVSELIARINYHINVGHFIFNVDEGTVRFAIEHHLDDSTLTPKTVFWLVEGAIDAITFYYPAFTRLLAEGLSPSEAIRISVQLDKESVGKASPEVLAQSERIRAHLRPAL